VNILWAVEIEDRRLLSQKISRKCRGPDHLKREVESEMLIHCVALRKMAMLVRKVLGQPMSVSAIAKSQAFSSFSRRQAVIYGPSCVNAEIGEGTLITKVQWCTAFTETHMALTYRRWQRKHTSEFLCAAGIGKRDMFILNTVLFAIIRLVSIYCL
jgi:hypothetical protein